MFKIKNLTEDKYTLYDIFAKNCEKWLLVPLFCFLLTPFLNMIVFSVRYKAQLINDDISHYFRTGGENPGDYYVAMIDAGIVLGLLFTVIAVISSLVFCKRTELSPHRNDKMPMQFFVVFCALITVSCLVNKISNRVIFGLTPRGESLFAIFAYFLVFYLCGSLIRSEKLKYLVVWFILFVGFVIGVLSIVNNFVVDVTIIYDNGLCGIFKHFNFYGYFLTINILLCAAMVVVSAKKPMKVFAFILFCFNTVILALNNTMGCFLACIVALVFMAAFVSIKNKKFSFSSLAMFVLFLTICFGVSFFFDSFFTQLMGLAKDVKTIATDSENAAGAGTARWGLWTHTAQYIKEKPWLGWGFEGSCQRLGEETGQDRAHNEYLSYAADYGIPAALIYIAGLISIYIKALKRRKHIDGATLCCLVAALGYIGSAFFGNTMVTVTPFFFIVLGLANSTGYDEPKIAKCSCHLEKKQ